MTFGKTLGWSLSVSMCMQNCIEIFQKVQEIGPVSLLSELGSRQSLDRWQMDLTMPWAWFCQYQRLCEISPKTPTRFKSLCYTRKYDVYSKKWCHIRKCSMIDLMLYTNVQTYVKHEYEMCSIRTNVTHENVICRNICYTRKDVVLCPNLCYIRKCVMSEHMLHTNMRFILSELSCQYQCACKISFK